LLLTAITLFVVLIVVGICFSWPLVDPRQEGLWLLWGAFIAVVAFVRECRDRRASRRIEIQLAFFDRWQEIKSEIELLAGEEDSAEAAMLFRRYFELLSLEDRMQHHINPVVLEGWNRFREAEFEDETYYAGKKFSEWWDDTKKRVVNEEFKSDMEACRRKAESNRCSCT
jgi:hypothetical protein